MRILSAVYLMEDGSEKEIHLNEITPSIYEKELKGKLYCITRGCPARISFSSGRKSHFRTWRFDEHSIDCIFQFDRIPVNLGINTTETASVEIPFNRRQNALREAFILMNLTEEAFIAERLNSSYLNKFWPVKRLLSRERQVLFTGIGDVRKNSRTNRLELVIYVGSDFKVNNVDMSSLAARFAREDL